MTSDSKRAVIVAGGGSKQAESWYYISELLSPDDFLIAVNGGTSVLFELNLQPDVVIGDLDSLPESEKRLLHDADNPPQILTFPPDKDKTDTELAVRYLLDSPCPPDEIVICEALGGRLDHELALLFYAASLTVNEGVKISLTDGNQQVFCITESAEVAGERGQTVSFIPLTPKVTNVYLRGFVYPLSGGTLHWGQTLGVSNVLSEPPGRVNIRGEGLLLAVTQLKQVDN